MRITLFLIVVIAVLIVICGNELAGATTYSSACSVSEAHARVHKAARAAHRAEARLAEARRVLTATRGYSALYGAGVSRWVWLSRQVGWPWGCFPTLMSVVSRESGGNPAAKNPYSTASGLLQMLAFHFDGSGSYGWVFNPFDPRQNLHHGWMLWHRGGWAPWAL